MELNLEDIFVGAASLLIKGLLSILLGLLGTGCLWSIRALKEQAKQVEQGWFPKNPKRK